MNNIAISRRTDQYFTNGKEYECTPAYAKFETACVNVLCDTGDMICIDINDPDFEISFTNITDKNVKNIPYIRGKYNPEYGDYRVCVCGSAYMDHFNRYDEMRPCRCRINGCNGFIGNNSTKNLWDIVENFPSYKENNEKEQNQSDEVDECLMERLTERDFKLGYDDSNKLPSYVAIYEKLRVYENQEEDNK